jgi:ESCRT-II complex subunit VPS36
LSVEQKQIKVEGYGILGIKQALKEETKDRNETMSTGFRDLKSLVDKSQELKNLAAKLKMMDDSQDPELKEIKESMASMGFTSGVTKESAGKNYLSQLAREVSDFIKSQLEKSGGLLPMVDVFCIYNRARGGNVVSPKDLNDACEMLETLCLPVRLKELASGTKALTLGNQAMEVLIKRVVEKVSEVGNLSAKAVADAFDINQIIALECLFSAERNGDLCRDEGIQGLQFYENLFRRGRVN